MGEKPWLLKPLLLSCFMTARLELPITEDMFAVRTGWRERPALLSLLACRNRYLLRREEGTCHQ